MSVCELMTLLKQYEQACPGREAMVQFTCKDESGEERTHTVKVQDFVWANNAIIKARAAS